MIVTAAAIAMARLIECSRRLEFSESSRRQISGVGYAPIGAGGEHFDEEVDVAALGLNGSVDGACPHLSDQ